MRQAHLRNILTELFMFGTLLFDIRELIDLGADSNFEFRLWNYSQNGASVCRSWVTPYDLREQIVLNCFRGNVKKDHNIRTQHLRLRLVHPTVTSHDSTRFSRARFPKHMKTPKGFSGSLAGTIWSDGVTLLRWCCRAHADSKVGKATFWLFFNETLIARHVHLSWMCRNGCAWSCRHVCFAQFTHVHVQIHGGKGLYVALREKYGYNQTYWNLHLMY